MASQEHRQIPLYEERTWDDIDAFIKAGAPIMVSLGATEQHGLHLPLGSDTMQGVEISRRAAHRLEAEGLPLLVGPAIPYGPKPFISESPRDFPGTINISHGLLQQLTKELCRELVKAGFRTIYLLIANAESDADAQIAAKEVVEESHADIVTLQWLIGIRSQYKGILKSSKPQGHGGEGETARMLATAPELVRLDRARSFHLTRRPEPPVAEDLLPYLGGGVGRYRLPEGSFAGFRDGITGDPQLGTEETGEKVYALITDWVCSAVRRDWIAAGRSLKQR